MSVSGGNAGHSARAEEPAGSPNSHALAVWKPMNPRNAIDGRGRRQKSSSSFFRVSSFVVSWTRCKTAIVFLAWSTAARMPSSNLVSRSATHAYSCPPPLSASGSTATRKNLVTHRFVVRLARVLLIFQQNRIDHLKWFHTVDSKNRTYWRRFTFKGRMSKRYRFSHVQRDKVYE